MLTDQLNHCRLVIVIEEESRVHVVTATTSIFIPFRDARKLTQISANLSWPPLIWSWVSRSRFITPKIKWCPPQFTYQGSTSSSLPAHTRPPCFFFTAQVRYPNYLNCFVFILSMFNAVLLTTSFLFGFFFFAKGDNGENMKQWLDIINRRELNFPHIKIVYPSAPIQPYTPYKGEVRIVDSN